MSIIVWISNSIKIVSFSKSNDDKNEFAQLRLTKGYLHISGVTKLDANLHPICLDQIYYIRCFLIFSHIGHDER